MIGLGCFVWLGTAPDRIPFLYTLNTKKPCLHAFNCFLSYQYLYERELQHPKILFWFIFSQMDRFLVRSSIFYVIYNDPPPTPLWRHSTKPQCRGPITWQCSISFVCMRNAFYTVFLSRIHDSIGLNHLMMFVGHWWRDSHYLHIIKLNLNKRKPKIGPNHWPEKWSFIDVGDGNVYGSDAARNTAVVL